MRSRVLTGIALVVGLVLWSRVGTAAAQFPEPKPGPEHKSLEPLVGKFKATVKMWLEPGKDPMTSEGTTTRKLIMNGLFLHEDFDGKFGGSTFTGMGIMGYDTMQKKYTGTWIDSMSTGYMAMEGTYDAKTKTFSMTMDDIDMATGKKVKMRDTLRIVDNDTQLQQFFRPGEGGKEMKVMEIEYKRIKK